MAQASVDGVFTNAVKSNTNNIVSISVNGVASAPSDLAVVTAGGFNFVNFNGQAPDASWTALGGAWWKLLPAVGALTVAQALAGSFTASQMLALFKVVPGKTPTFTVRGTGSGGSVLANQAVFTPAAGSSLLWMCCQVAQFPNNTSFVAGFDGGLNWSLLANVGIDDGQIHPMDCLMWYAENVPANPIPAGGLKLNVGNGGTWRLVEISNLLVGGGPRLLLSLGVGT